MSLETQVNIRFNTTEAKQATQEVNKLENSLSRVEDTGSKIGGRVGSGLSEIASTARGAISPLGAVGAAIAGLGAAAAITIGQLRQINDGLIDLAGRTGESVRELADLRAVAQLNGADFDKLSSILERVNRQAGAAADGNKTLADTFKLLNVDLTTFNDLTALEKFEAINRGLNSITDATKRAAAQQRIYGKSTQDALDVGVNAQDNLTEAQRIGLVVTDEQIELAAKQDEAFNKINASLQGLALSLTTIFGPETVELLENVASAINTIASATTEYKKEIELTISAITGLGSATKLIQNVAGTYAKQQRDDLPSVEEYARAIGNLGPVYDIVSQAIGAVTEGTKTKTEAEGESVKSKERLITASQRLAQAYRDEFEAQGVRRANSEAIGANDPTLESLRDSNGVIVQDIEVNTKPAEIQLQQFGNSFEDLTKQIIPDIGASFANSFAEGLATGELNFKSFLENLKKELLKAAILKLIGTLFGGGIGGVQNGVFFNQGTASNGRAFDGPVTPFSNGGIVGTPTKFFSGGGVGLAGEAGAEGILPLKRGRDGKLGVTMNGSGSGGATYVITNNVTVNGGDNPDETAEATTKAIDQLMERKIKAVLQNERRSGNSLSPAVEMY